MVQLGKNKMHLHRDYSRGNWVRLMLKMMPHSKHKQSVQCRNELRLSCCSKIKLNIERSAKIKKKKTSKKDTNNI